MGEALESKSFKFALISVLAILALALIAGLIAVTFGVTIPYIGEAIAGITGNSAINTARNVYVDGPIRKAQLPSGQPPVPPPVGGA